MARILWADDEIDLLKPHVMFLENKGHELTTVQSGNEAIDAVKEEDFEIIFLDENMPGLTGLETLDHIKAEKPSIPIVMITKSEEESIMDSAIGGRINDYLIKPVNPNQILLSIKKNLEGKRLVNEKTTSSYQQKFRELSMDLQDRLMPLHTSMFCETSPGPVKYAASLLGKCTSEARLPICEISEANKEIVKKAMANAGLLN